jgi:O-antigen ligase
MHLSSLSSSRFWVFASLLLLLGALAASINPLTLSASVPFLGISLGIGYRITFGKWPSVDWPLAFFLFAPALLGMASSLWSITPAASFERALKIGGLMVPAIWLFSVIAVRPDSVRAMFAQYAPVIYTVLAMGVAVELVFDFPLYRWFSEIPADTAISTSILNKFMAVLVLPLPYLISFLLQQRKYYVLAMLVGATFIALLTTQSQAAQLASLVMIAAWIGTRIFPRIMPSLTFLVVAFFLVVLPWLAPFLYNHLGEEFRNGAWLVRAASSSERLEVYTFVSERIQENPLYGFGMDCTRSITDFVSAKKYFPSSTIMHPHNIGLQLWIEFGSFGIALALSTLLFIYRRLRMRLIGEQILPFTVFCGTVVFLMVSWSLWASWLISLQLFMLALTLLVSPPAQKRLPEGLSETASPV